MTKELTYWFSNLNLICWSAKTHPEKCSPQHSSIIIKRVLFHFLRNKLLINHHQAKNSVTPKLYLSLIWFHCSQEQVLKIYDLWIASIESLSMLNRYAWLHEVCMVGYKITRVTVGPLNGSVSCILQVYTLPSKEIWDWIYLNFYYYVQFVIHQNRIR